MAYVTVINEHQHVQQIVSGHHHLTADATASSGGSDAGFAPRELLLASLGTCTAIALRKHAGRQRLVLGQSDRRPAMVTRRRRPRAYRPPPVIHQASNRGPKETNPGRRRGDAHHEVTAAGNRDPVISRDLEFVGPGPLKSAVVQ